ncbi:SDR family oxidoreductase [Brochothrix campestris]|uniref:Enoyl-[acyl-carrier-protein] reductase [NADH] n=1 Tax=Brochothrix campestris FSL F6-1037 TaxID=1265861 RepID=W7CTV1_9LIST|nr:SDR family oxidoreductase [Brochothrix campestris]EUJ39261.1 enoyl-(acyl carrier protein) reductase [Brochothrix campestris FSL F6-1037]
MYLNFENKTVLIMGVANKRSIGWGIAKELDKAGAKLIFSYSKERSAKGLLKLALELSDLNKEPDMVKCDVTSDEDIATAVADLKVKAGQLSGIVHSVAFANKDFLGDAYSAVDRASFAQALDISAYSFTAIIRAAHQAELLADNASLITLTYLGGERVIQNYNLMGVAKAALESSVRYLANEYGPTGIRVNAISAGPIRTLSARGVGNFSESQKMVEERAPLRRVTTSEEVGTTALFLLSDMASGITGENIHVDSGYHIIGY